MQRVFAVAAVLTWFALPLAAVNCEADERKFSHGDLASGPVCIPRKPERIFFSLTEIVPAMLLGYSPIARTTPADEFLVDYPAFGDAETYQALPKIGFPVAEVESVAALRPELIVSTTNLRELNEIFEKIAPLVVRDRLRTVTKDWRAEHAFVASVLKRTELNEQMMRALEDRIERTRTALLANWDGEIPSYAVVYPIDAIGQVKVYTNALIGPQVLEEIGFRRGAKILSADDAANYGSSTFYTLTAERLLDLDVTYLFVLPEKNSEADDAARNQPLWNVLPAVLADRVVYLSGDGRHATRAHIAAAHLILDDVYRGVLGQDPATENPNPFAHWTAKE